jgi:hypothetical protein
MSGPDSPRNHEQADHEQADHEQADHEQADHEQADRAGRPSRPTEQLRNLTPDSLESVRKRPRSLLFFHKSD